MGRFGTITLSPSFVLKCDEVRERHNIAWRFFYWAVMESGRIKPDTTIKGYCKAGQTQKAMEKLRDMDARGVDADKITYMTIIQACYADSDFGFEPDVVTYSAVVNGLCKNGRVEEALCYFKTCQGLAINSIFYSSKVDWESRLPVVLGPRKSRLSLFTRKQQKLLDEARKMDGVPDLSALLKGKLQLLSKKSIPADVQGSTSSNAGRASKEGAPGLVDKDVGAEPPASSPKKKKKSKKSRRKTTEELPLEEIASLDETSEGLEARKEERGRKRPYEGANSSIDHGEAPAVGREGATRGSVESDRSEAAPEDRPRKKKKKKSIEAEPCPSDVETSLVEVVAGGDVSLETPPEEREVSAQGSDPVTGERSIPDPSARKGSRSEGSTVRRKKIEFPDRVEFSYNETTPQILNPLRCAELTRQIRGGMKEMPQLDDLYFKTEYIDAASSRARSDGSMNFLVEKYDSTLKQTMIQLGSSEKLAQTRLKVIERVRAEHKKANEKAAEEKEILRVDITYMRKCFAHHWLIYMKWSKRR
ncbi:hypothetical protein F2Q70_00029153 [Brassica cretica]|uniref:Pentatricopeptide repeat-containing protein n=1 Tax=Brassica cretica TaxID=69181 RepID=A0A8S9FRR9_BRACR|nr:hypothetical protein F2Q70_00029153 [Brassica cretica]